MSLLLYFKMQVTRTLNLEPKGMIDQLRNKVCDMCLHHRFTEPLETVSPFCAINGKCCHSLVLVVFPDELIP